MSYYRPKCLRGNEIECWLSVLSDSGAGDKPDEALISRLAGNYEMREASIPREQMAKVSYVRHVPRDGRVVPLLACFSPESREWRLFVEGRPGEIDCLDAVPISSSYLATEPVDPAHDLELPLGTLVTRYLSFLDVLEPLGKLEDVLQRCASILEKYHLIWQQRSTAGGSASLLIESELEYLLLTLRSFYDVLQHLARQVIRRFVYLDHTRGRVKGLPRSFADVVMRGDEAVTEADLQTRYAMPEALSRWYAAEAQFFNELRRLRDGIVHHGRRLPTIFEVEWGFAIDPSQLPWSRFDLWPVEQRWELRLGALRAVFASFIIHSMRASTRLTNILARLVELPPPVTELNFFVRSPFGDRLVNLNSIREQPWEGLVGGVESSLPEET